MFSGRLLGLFLFYLASINHFLALTVETCTSGSADSLGGILLSIPLYTLAIALFTLRPLILGWAILAPAVCLFFYCAYWSLKLAIGFWLTGDAACNLVWGGVYPHDGRERLFAILHASTVAITSAGLIFLVRRSYLFIRRA